jgi:hypothetical protein
MDWPNGPIRAAALALPRAPVCRGAAGKQAGAWSSPIVPGLRESCGRGQVHPMGVVPWKRGTCWSWVGLNACDGWGRSFCKPNQRQRESANLLQASAQCEHDLPYFVATVPRPTFVGRGTWSLSAKRCRDLAALAARSPHPDQRDTQQGQARWLGSIGGTNRATWAAGQTLNLLVLGQEQRPVGIIGGNQIAARAAIRDDRVVVGIVRPISTRVSGG